MRPRSLRSKIFSLVGLTTLLGAVAVLLVTQRDVTHTVVASEEHAVHNVLNLLLQDSEARWGALLSDKITTVRSARAQLLELGAMMGSVLALYANEVEHGAITQATAQAMARQWINSLPLGEERFAFAFDDSLSILASGQPAWLGVDLSAFRDFKGRELAQSAYNEARTTGHGFALYRWPTPNPGDSELMYAYFGYFEPWDWVFAITGNAHRVVREFELRRAEMERAVRETLSSLQLAQSGFAFIMDDSGQLISPLPAAHRRLLDATPQASPDTLRKRLLQPIRVDTVHTFSFEDPDHSMPWQISAAYFKPLGWTIVAAVPENDLTAAAYALRNRLAALFALVLLVSLAAAWALSARITRPLKQLTDFARTLPEQDLRMASTLPNHIVDLSERQSDEVGRLATTFIYMDEQLRDKVAHLVQETSRRERFESELSIARSIQMGLLPDALPSQALRGLALHATMLPAKEVGGDLYDYFLLPNQRLCLVIGDVSDKGVPAALFMAVTRTLIRACAEDEYDPARLIERINNRLSEHNPNLMFVTLVVCVLDPDTGELSWANAGHPAPCVISPTAPLRLLHGRSGPACGVQSGLPYRAFSTILKPGETLFGYTDGITEALSPDGQLYGEDRLYQWLNQFRTLGAQALADALHGDIQHFALGMEQSDDITMIVAQRVGP